MLPFIDRGLAAGAVLGAASCAAAQSLNVNITGTTSVDMLGAPGNSVLHVALPPSSIVNGLGWNVNLTAFSPSWRSEMCINFSDSLGGQAYTFRPAAPGDGPGSAAYASPVIPIPGITVGLDGILRLEFHELFDDFPGAADGVWSGSVRGESDLTIRYIPGPAAALLGMPFMLNRRRRAKN